MRNFSNLFRTAALACVMALTISACGDSSNSGLVGPATPNPVFDDPAPVTGSGVFVSGTVTAPGATVTQLEGRNTFFNVAMNYVIAPVYADIIGLQPVTTGTAELFEIDDDGNQVGDILATAPLSITGQYSLELPVGVSFAANLVVRVTSGSLSMRAMVVEEAVDINPISEFVLSKFVDDDTLTLADLPTNQVIALRGRVEEFDFTSEADLSGMLAKLEADLGELVETEIEDSNKTEDDGTLATAAAGNWNLINFSLGLFDNEAANFGTFGMDMTSSSVTLAADDTNLGEVTATETAILLDIFTNFNFDGQGLTSIYNEIELDTDGEGRYSPVYSMPMATWHWIFPLRKIWKPVTAPGWAGVTRPPRSFWMIPVMIMV